MNTKAIPTYLLVFGLLALGACTTDYLITIDLQYVNDTDSTISFNMRDGRDFFNEIVLLPGMTSSVLSYERMGPKEIDPEECCSGIVMNLFESEAGVYIHINDTLCVVQTDEIVNGDKYESFLINKRHIKHVYTFTGSDLSGTEMCND